MSNNSAYRRLSDSRRRQSPTGLPGMMAGFPVYSNATWGVDASCLTFLKVCETVRSSTESVKVSHSDPTNWIQHWQQKSTSKLT